MKSIINILTAIISAIAIGGMGWAFGKREGKQNESNKRNEEHNKSAQKEASDRAKWNNNSDDVKLKWLQSLFPKGKDNGDR